MPIAGGSVVVLGAGGHAKVVISAARAAGLIVVGLCDDDPAKQGSVWAGVPVQGFISNFKAGAGSQCVIGIGDNARRQEIAQRHSPLDWATLVHPRAYVHESVRLGPGTVVFAGAVVQPDARIGAHCIINTGATVDHESVIGDFCHVAPGCNLGGAVTLDEGVFMGIGSVAIPLTTVGAWSIVGAGAAVVNDLPDHVVAVGVPARVRRKLEVRPPMPVN